MRIPTVNLKHIVTALALSVSLFGPALAEPVPPELMDRLRAAQGVDAARIAREVETYWARSGSAAMDLLLKRGRDALEKGDYDIAIEHLTALTDHAPGFAEGYHQRAQAFYRAGLYGPAVEDLERTLALNPDNYNAIFGFAVVLQEFGDLEAATALIRMVLDINPNHENAQSALDALERDGIGRAL